MDPVKQPDSADPLINQRTETKTQSTEGVLKVHNQPHNIHYSPKEQTNTEDRSLKTLLRQPEGTTPSHITVTPFPEKAGNLFKVVTQVASRSMIENGDPSSPLLHQKADTLEPTFKEQLFKLFPFLLKFAAGLLISEIKLENRTLISDSTLKMLRTRLEESPQALIDFENFYQDNAVKPHIISFLAAHTTFVGQKDADQDSVQYQNFRQASEKVLTMVGLHTSKTLTEMSKTINDLAKAHEFSKKITELLGRSIDSPTLDRAVEIHPDLIPKLEFFFALREKIAPEQVNRQIRIDKELESVSEEGEEFSNVTLMIEKTLHGVEGGKDIADTLWTIHDCANNPLKKDTMEFFGEGAKKNMDKIVTWLLNPVKNPQGALLDSYVAMVEAAIEVGKIHSQAQANEILYPSIIEKFYINKYKFDAELNHLGDSKPKELLSYCEPFMKAITAKVIHPAKAREFSEKITKLSDTYIDFTILERAINDHPDLISKLESFFVLRDKVATHQHDNKIGIDTEKKASLDQLQFSQITLEIKYILQNINGGKEIVNSLWIIQDYAFNPLKKDMVKLFGESAKEHMEEILRFLLESDNDPKETLLHSYVAMVEAAIEAKKDAPNLQVNTNAKFKTSRDLFQKELEELKNRDPAEYAQLNQILSKGIPFKTVKAI